MRRAAAPLQAGYLFHPEANKSAALNAALHELQDGLVVFLDDDVRVGEGLLRAYVAAASGIAPGVFFGGPVHAESRGPASVMAPAVLALPRQGGGVRGIRRRRWSHRPSFSALNWAAFAKNLKEVGSFDPWFENRFGNGEHGPGNGDAEAAPRSGPARPVRA